MYTILTLLLILSSLTLGTYAMDKAPWAYESNKESHDTTPSQGPNITIITSDNETILLPKEIILYSTTLASQLADIGGQELSSPTTSSLGWYELLPFIQKALKKDVTLLQDLIITTQGRLNFIIEQANFYDFRDLLALALQAWAHKLRHNAIQKLNNSELTHDMAAWPPEIRLKLIQALDKQSKDFYATCFITISSLGKRCEVYDSSTNMTKASSGKRCFTNFYDFNIESNSQICSMRTIDKILKLYSLNTVQEIDNLGNSKSYARTANKDLVIVHTQDSLLLVRNIKTNTYIHNFGIVYSYKLSYDSSILVFVDKNYTFHLINTSTFEDVGQFTLPADYKISTYSDDLTITNSSGVIPVAISSSTPSLAFQNTDNILTLYTLQAKKVITHQLEVGSDGHSLDTTSHSFSPNGDYFVTHNQDKTKIYLWDVKSGILLKEFTTQIIHSTDTAEADANTYVSPCFSPNNLFFVFPFNNKTAHVWNIKEERLVATASCSRVLETLTFNPQSTILVLASHHHRAFEREGLVDTLSDEEKAEYNRKEFITLWDISTNQEITRLRGYSTVTGHPTFNHQGNLLAYLNFDNTIVLFDVKNKKEFLVYTPPVSSPRENDTQNILTIKEYPYQHYVHFSEDDTVLTIMSMFEDEFTGAAVTTYKLVDKEVEEYRKKELTVEQALLISFITTQLHKNQLCLLVPHEKSILKATYKLIEQSRLKDILKKSVPCISNSSQPVLNLSDTDDELEDTTHTHKRVHKNTLEPSITSPDSNKPVLNLDDTDNESAEIIHPRKKARRK